ncbi:cytohesin 4b isoform X1 [Antennarius striatus]|uniref:cytohesin 4b isoform X1 n=1 Tax=Antennarius striatus TaxID=241820 RepID=UPI0035B297B8
MTDDQMVFPDFTADEKMELENIKTYKKDLLDDIQKLKLEIDKIMEEILSFKPGEENKALEKSKRFSNGKKKFNMDPKKGINYLVEHKLLDRSPQVFAEFLYKEEGLDKTAIGDFLGEREEIHLQTLKAFVDLHEFSDLNLVQALRQFLWSFRLPGEAQKIDRMMEAFATRYCDCNAEVFQSADTCYILSFAIIMLNTSLHNPCVKDKTTLERFISMNRGINSGENLPDELLEKLFESIRNEPFKIPLDDGNDLTHTFFNPDREGWLLKLGGRVKTWKRRWFILTDNCLYYFEFTTDKEPRGIIPLENLCVREVSYARKPVRRRLSTPRLLTDPLHVDHVALVSSSTAWSCTTPTVQEGRLKPAKPKRTAGWCRVNTNPTPYVLPTQKKETCGSRPSGRVSPKIHSTTWSQSERRR